LSDVAYVQTLHSPLRRLVIRAFVASFRRTFGMLHKSDFHGNEFSADLGLSSSQLFKLLWRARHWSLVSFPSKGRSLARMKTTSVTGPRWPGKQCWNFSRTWFCPIICLDPKNKKQKKRRYSCCHFPQELYTAIPRHTSSLA
jgi:hypothetical protein